MEMPESTWSQLIECLRNLTDAGVIRWWKDNYGHQRAELSLLLARGNFLEIWNTKEEGKGVVSNEGESVERLAAAIERAAAA